MGNSILFRRTYRTVGCTSQIVTSNREGGQRTYFSWDFMVRIKVAINSTSRTAEEDFMHRFVFSPLPPPLRFSRERLLPSFRSSSSFSAESFREGFVRVFFFFWKLVDWLTDRFYFKTSERCSKKKRETQVNFSCDSHSFLIGVFLSIIIIPLSVLFIRYRWTDPYGFGSRVNADSFSSVQFLDRHFLSCLRTLSRWLNNGLGFPPDFVSLQLDGTFA